MARGPSGGDWVDGWFETAIRVQYPECDPQGVVHHAIYLHYFEFARTEMLRAAGCPYTAIEEKGLRLVVTESALRHRAPARYDDVLRVRARIARASRVRVYLEYSILREVGDAVLCEGSTVLACLDRSGRPTGLPAAIEKGPRG